MQGQTLVKISVASKKIAREITVLVELGQFYLHEISILVTLASAKAWIFTG